MAAGCGDGVQCGGAGALYIAGGLLRWQEQHKRGRRGEEGMFVFSFYSSLSESMGLIVEFGPILSGVSITG